MRKYKLLENVITHRGLPVKKVMICEIKPTLSAMLYFYETKKDGFASDSQNFDSVEQAELYCESLGIGNSKWIEIADSMDYCNLDWIAPVRRKGRNIGEYYGDGIWEKFDGTNWIEFSHVDTAE